ncbi:MAG: hypothetical protein ACYTF8_03290 [Planctomycetota bacterium]|jgi:hypothetical protein
MRAEKPMMVYVTSDDPTDKVTRKLEAVVFANEKVCLGAKFFDTIKVSAGDALQDRILSENGRYSPRLVLLTREYKVVAVLQKKQISGGKLLKAMQRVAKMEYATSFDTMVRNYTKLLNELDRLESKKSAIADQRRRLQEKPNKSRDKKIARDEAKYEAEMNEWKKKEEAVLKFRVKGEKARA